MTTIELAMIKASVLVCLYAVSLIALAIFITDKIRAKLARLRLKRLLPKGWVYTTTTPVYVGRIPPRQDILIVPMGPRLSADHALEITAKIACPECQVGIGVRCIVNKSPHETPPNGPWAHRARWWAYEAHLNPVQVHVLWGRYTP